MPIHVNVRRNGEVRSSSRAANSDFGESEEEEEGGEEKGFAMEKHFKRDLLDIKSELAEQRGLLT